MRLILLGAPGAGKGSQAELLTKKYSIPHISTGDIFRANIKEATELGLLAKSYIDKGLLVPDEVTIMIVKKRLSEKDCENGFLLDGYPRTIPQAESLNEVLNEMKVSINAVVNIDVEDALIVKRLSGRRVCTCGMTYHLENKPPLSSGVCDRCGLDIYQREDDKEETIMRRLSTYHDQTEPLINYYRAQSLIVDVDGSRDIKTTYEEIIEKLG